MKKLLGEIIISVVILIFALFMVRPIFSSMLISAGKIADAHLEQQENGELEYLSPHSSYGAAPM